ncbi:HNH endonuclease [Burkholderia multivorans]|uniref:HNH endonuclease n=1 Tax=Burkholderia multivorans TaxID=87883 RepID=UPI00286FAFF9|nr:HNH endonuclease [Burkholderia multivorans]
MASEQSIAISRLHELFSYNPKTGSLIRKTRTSRPNIGDEAGSLTDKGYLRVLVDGARIYVHRIAWAMHYGKWPDALIDHKNLVKSANRIGNLRLASNASNSQNRRTRTDNKIGLKGVSEKHGRFWSRIKVNGREKSLGFYDTAEEAHEVYCLAADMLHGRFSNHG